MEVDGGDAALPFVRQFYGSPSMYWWTDDMGVTHEIWQGEGVEQGDPLMPALYACGQHRALVHVSEDLLDTERLFAFMDDIYVSSKPDRTGALHQSLDREMWEHARIRLHQGKTQLWNRGGVAPEGWEMLTVAARRSDPSAVVWKGDPSLPVSEQGLRILGTPLGHPEYVHDQLRRASADHRLFLERIPAVQDLQSAWLLLSYCAGTRANNLLRSIPPPMATTPCLSELVCSGSWLPRFLRSRGKSLSSRTVGPPEWAKGESSGLLVQLGGLFGDHLKTAACRGRTVGDSLTNGAP